MSTPPLALPTSVEERITGWIRLQEAQRQQPKPKPPGPSITLSRQFGCEGFPLSLRLKERMEAATGEPWTIFDRALIDRVASDAGLSSRVLANLGDETRILEKFGFHPRGPLTNDEAFRKVAPFIIKVAREGHAIIMGRGGAVLCAGLANIYHFRLIASFEWRVESLSQRTGLPATEAARLVATQGRLRAKFIEDVLGADVEAFSHYDAIYNNQHHTVGHMAESIRAYVAAGDAPTHPGF